MKKRNLAIAALTSVGALTFLLVTALSPPNPVAQAQNTSCPNGGVDCFDTVDRLIVGSLGHVMNYDISGSINGEPDFRSISFDAQHEGQKLGANRCLNLARRAQQKSNVALTVTCGGSPSPQFCDLREFGLNCSLENR